MSAVETKDRILAMLHGAEGEAQYLEVAEKVIEIVDIILPTWAEIGYAYKASEIAERIADQLRWMEIEASHHARRSKIGKIGVKARELARSAHAAQAQYFAA